MSLYAIVGDSHFDVRGGDIDFLDFQIKWHLDVFRQCKAMGIKTVVQVGDFLNNRKTVDVRVMDRILNELLPALDEFDLDLFLLAGNHNIYYRDSNDIHNLNFMEHHSRVTVIKEWGEANGILYLGWLNKNNTDELMKVVANSKAKYCFGHLELAEFPMYKGIPAVHGQDGNLFSKFEKVITGHYHTVSNIGNITYVGSPYHLTWADYPDGVERGWFTFDTESGKLELVKNRPDQSLFAVFNHDPEVKYEKKDLEHLAGKIVRIVVKNKGDTRRYNAFLSLLREIKFIEYRIVDETIVEKKEVVAPINPQNMLTDLGKFITDYSARLAATVPGADVELTRSISLELYQKAAE
jgi:metallophosphoesterase superfamily enzyme